ncbi:hypothetical protein AB0J74_18705 [Asanoa sp. NPDC049573]|uniref:hypothetical protein n=1 Tax=Asanoa sp. NPDC049573 TaxID=3155396 RepID=UPI00341A4920
MRLTIKVDEDGLLHWTLLRSVEQPEPIAYGTRGYRQQQDCYRAAESLLRAPADLMRPVRQRDGRWRWAVLDTDGAPLAVSPATFDNPATCGYALHDVRVAMGRRRDLAGPPIPVGYRTRSR